MPPKLSSHSEFGRLHTVFLKRAESAFLNQQCVDAEWNALGFLGPPSFSRAVAEYSAFDSLVSQAAARVCYLPADPSLTLDSLYCRDAAFATDAGMILCRMGKESRRGEPESLAVEFHRLGIPVLGRIVEPGILEGGDLAWIDSLTLAVGLGYRTNESGIEQVRGFLAPMGIRILVVPLAHYRGPSDVFHLMSVFSPVDRKTVVVYSPLMPAFFRQWLLAERFRLVEVPDAEFETLGCNVLALAPGDCLVLKGNSGTQTALEQAGCRVTVYSGTDISYPGGGGPTCLTRPIWRELPED
jgi:N-dimethylarginine dimethylaminohydrolase